MTSRQKADHLAIGTLLAIGVAMLLGWPCALAFLLIWSLIAVVMWR